MIFEMILFFSGSVFVCRTALSVYDKDEAKRRYITIQSPWLVKALVGGRHPWSEKKLRKKDRNKLSIGGAVGYLLNLIALLIGGLSAVAPIRPSSPYISDPEDRFVELDTGNIKVAYAAIFFAFCWMLGATLVRIISWVRKDDMHIALKAFLLILLFHMFFLGAVGGVWLSLDILLSI